MKPIANNLVLELHVPDFVRARDFYGLFGFSEIQFDPPTENAPLGYLVLRRLDPSGATLLNFFGGAADVVRHSHFLKFPQATPRGYAVEITIPVADICELWTKVGTLLDQGRIAQPLAIKPWGSRDFRVVDPFGFYLRFTELVDWGQGT